MTPEAQVVFFKKIRSLFSRATVGVALMAKKKYRIGSDDLVKVRNLCVLFSQVWPHLKVRLSAIDAAAWEDGFLKGTAYDDDFIALLDTRPPKVSLSMLKSQQEVAKKKEQEKQQMICSEVAQQREAVLDAQWKFFQSALRQDQSMLSKVKLVPAKIKARLHEKAVVHRQQQGEAGQKATNGYQAGCFCIGPLLFPFLIDLGMAEYGAPFQGQICNRFQL